MKVVERTEIKVIEAKSGAEFESLMNNALRDVSSHNSKYQIHWNLSMGHCAYIEYAYTEKIPETLMDEYALRGEVYYCGNCPKFYPSTDGRSRAGQCLYGKCNKPIPSDKACKHFYQKIDSGEWEIRE